MSILKSVALIPVLAVVLAACGGEATPEAKAPEAAATEAKPAEGDAAKPAEGDAAAAPAGDAAKPEGEKPAEGGDAK